METKTAPKVSEGHFKWRVIERERNYEQSKLRGKLPTFDELPSFLNTHIEDLENTSYYRKNGYVSFYLDTQDTENLGYYRFNRFEKLVGEMFVPLRDSDGKTYAEGFNIEELKRVFFALPFEERAGFNQGYGPLLVTLESPSHGHGRIFIGPVSPDIVADVIVVREETYGWIDKIRAIFPQLRIG